jgi:hypothetical protein
MQIFQIRKQKYNVQVLPQQKQKLSTKIKMLAAESVTLQK